MDKLTNPKNHALMAHQLYLDVREEGWNAEAITRVAKRHRKSRQWVKTYILLCGLVPSLLNKLDSDNSSGEILRTREAIIIARLPHEQQEAAYAYMVSFPVREQLAALRSYIALTTEKTWVKRGSWEKIPPPEHIAKLLSKDASGRADIFTVRFFFKLYRELDIVIDTKHSVFTAEAKRMSPEARVQLCTKLRETAQEMGALADKIASMH